jgi:hypothetical protein
MSIPEDKTTAEKYENALHLELNGEDGSLYLATVCSMLELAQLGKSPKVNKVLIEDAKTMQHSLARHGKVIRIT